MQTFISSFDHFCLCSESISFIPFNGRNRQ